MQINKEKAEKKECFSHSNTGCELFLLFREKEKCYFKEVLLVIFVVLCYIRWTSYVCSAYTAVFPLQ